VLSTTNRTIFPFDIWEPDGFHPVLILIWKWEPDGSPIRLSFQNQNDNRMSMPSGCHFQIKWIFFKWQPNGGAGAIRLSFYFEMTAGWRCHPVVILFWNDNQMGCHPVVILFWNDNRMECHPVVILFWNDNRMRVPSGCHFFWNVNRMGVPSGSYFFSYMNRIGSVVELKIYIRVQEEDIRVQEEFVYLWFNLL